MRSKALLPAKKLAGQIALPGDKSISHRAIMLGALAKGRTLAKGVLDCDDCNCTIAAFREMGIEIRKSGDVTVICGNGLKGLKAPTKPIHVGESGTTMRIMAGILSGQPFKVTLTGGESLLRRPMDRVVEPLKEMGVDIAAGRGGLPPLTIKGGSVKPISYAMPVQSAQVKSAILFAGLYADGTTSVQEKYLSRDHTERMMRSFGADIKADGLKVSIKGAKELTAQTMEIPGDSSSAAFFIAGATLLDGSKLIIKNVSVNPTRAGIIDILMRMGAGVTLKNERDLYEPVADMEIVSAKTRGTVIEASRIPAIIDELPILFVVAALSKGKTIIKGSGELRVKETDRIASMQKDLTAMGAKFNIDGDIIVIEGVEKLKGAPLESFGDHRTCMSMAIAALTAQGESRIDDIECVSKSFPGFFDTLDTVARR